jgi:hypothetical protein
MRLSVAAAVLAQRVVPSHSESRIQDTRILLGTIDSGSSTILHGGPFTLHPNGAKTAVVASFLEKISKLKSQGALRNIPEEVVECDPTLTSLLSSSLSSDDADVADVGVLACGGGRHCMGSSNSSLGGVCTDNVNIHRDLGIDYSGMVEKIEYLCSDDCECFETCSCDINGTEARADVNCSSANVCFELPGICTGGQMFTGCLNKSFVATATDPENFSFENCYIYFYPDNLNKSFTFSYCYGRLQKG